MLGGIGGDRFRHSSRLGLVSLPPVWPSVCVRVHVWGKISVCVSVSVRERKTI